MADHASFLSVVQKWWEVNNHGTSMFRVWNKLKAVKHGLKGLHDQEFAKLDERIELASVQSQLASSPSDSTLQSSEKVHSEKLMKFLHVQESAYRPKSRILWLKARDSKKKIFFSAMKERHSKINIDVLYDHQVKKDDNYRGD